MYGVGMVLVLAPDPVMEPEASATGCWEGFGIRSLSHWLMWKAGLSPAKAAEIARLAEAQV